jgi:exodeoxyribonuclease VII small subunit
MTTEPTTDQPLGSARTRPHGGGRRRGLSFDDAFAQLRAVVTELEAGGLSLEETIARTERAVALQRHCERLLGEAELRIQQLIARPGGGLDVREITRRRGDRGLVGGGRSAPASAEDRHRRDRDVAAD